MTWRTILLLVIILGVLVSLLANLMWNYLPDSKVYPGTYTVAFIAIVIMCMLFLLFGSEGSTKGFLARVWKPGFLTRLQPNITPQKKITFILNTEGEAHVHWDCIEFDGDLAMSIRSLWYVTNLTDEDIWILRAYLEKTGTDGSISFPDRYSGHTSISPKNPTKISVDFCIQPSTCKKGEIFKGKIAFIDHFNKKHKVKVTLKPPIQVGETEPIQVGETEDDDIPF